VLAPEADEAYFALPRARRWAWRLAGPLAVYGGCVLLGLAALVADGRHVDMTTVEVLPGGPAARAGMLTGDRIVAVNGARVATWEQMRKLVAAGAPAGEVVLAVRRGTVEESLVVAPDAGKIMVRSQTERLPMPIGTALSQAMVAPVTILVRQAAAALSSVTGQREAELAGPVGIARQVRAGAEGARRRLALALGMLMLAVGTVWPLAMGLELVLGPRGRPLRRSAPPSPSGASS